MYITIYYLFYTFIRSIMQATKKGGENVEKLKAAADKMIKTVSEKLDLGTDVTPEKIKQSVASGFETISSQVKTLFIFHL